MRHRSLQQVVVPLFPRYLFVQLGSDRLDKSWAPIRSTHGVMHIVRFGAQAARIQTELIEWLRQQELALSQTPKTAFTPSQIKSKPQMPERIPLPRHNDAAFSGLA